MFTRGPSTTSSARAKSGSLDRWSPGSVRGETRDVHDRHRKGAARPPAQENAPRQVERRAHPAQDQEADDRKRGHQVGGEEHVHLDLQDPHTTPHPTKERQSARWALVWSPLTLYAGLTWA